MHLIKRNKILILISLVSILFLTLIGFAGKKYVITHKVSQESVVLDSSVMYSDLLQLQTGIYSSIVTAVLAITAFSIWLINKNAIDQAIGKFSRKIEKDTEKKDSALDKRFKSLEDSLEEKYNSLDADIARSMALTALARNNKSNDLLWSCRSADSFSKTIDEEMCTVMLSSAVGQMSSLLELDRKYIDEIEKILIRLVGHSSARISQSAKMALKEFVGESNKKPTQTPSPTSGPTTPQS